MRGIAVYCGSSPGCDAACGDAARELGRRVAGAGLDLVYGGSRNGLMGMVADAALAAGGRVVGVIPQGLVDREQAHTGLTELLVVNSMHERKRIMAERADAFVALPGGIGTLEELFEMLSWAQLGIHQKPCAVLNVGGYYDLLLRFLDQCVDAGMIRPHSRSLLLCESDPSALLERLAGYRLPVRQRWLDSDQG